MNLCTADHTQQSPPESFAIKTISCFLHTELDSRTMRYDPVRPDLIQYISQQNKVRNMAQCIRDMLNQLLSTTGSEITKVCEFSNTAADLQIGEGSVRILCIVDAFGRGLKFYFENANSMSKVIGIGVKDSKVILKRNLQTRVYFRSYMERRWKAILSKASKNKSIHQDVVVKFPRAHVDKESNSHALSSKEFGVGFKRSHEIFNNTCTSADRVSKVAPILWEVAIHFLLKFKEDIQLYVEENVMDPIPWRSPYLDVHKEAGSGGGEEGINFVSSLHLGECSSTQHNAAPPPNSSAAPSQKTSGGGDSDKDDDGDDDDDSSSDEEGDEESDGDGGDDEDWDENLNPPTEDIDDENLSGTVTVVFKGVVGKFHPNYINLQNYAPISPWIQFQFVKKSKDDREITISSRAVYHLLSPAFEREFASSNEFGWLHDLLTISMSSCEQEGAILTKYDLCKDFEGTPLAEEGKEIIAISSTSENTEARECTKEAGVSAKILSGKVSSNVRNTHQDSKDKGKTMEIPVNIYPGSFTATLNASENEGRLGYVFMQPVPHCDAIRDAAILWTDNPERRSIMVSGRCTTFAPVLRGTWKVLDDQEEAEYIFECGRQLSKLHRETTQKGYSERKVQQHFSFMFTVNHKMTHLRNIPESRTVQTSGDEIGKKEIVERVISRIFAK